MKYWVPVNLLALAWLPTTGERAFTEIEALVALQADYWYRRPACIRGYAEQWGWHRRRVRDFLAEVGVEIVGQVGRRPGNLQHSCGPANSQKIFCDFGRIGDSENKSGPANGGEMERWPSNGPHLHADKNKYKKTTTTLQEVDEGGDEKIKEYILFAQRNGKIKNPIGFEQFLLKKGLNPVHEKQLQGWKKEDEEKQKKEEIMLIFDQKKEREKEKVEVVWADYLEMSADEKGKIVIDVRETLPHSIKRDFDPEKEFYQNLIKSWLFEKQFCES